MEVTRRIPGICNGRLPVGLHLRYDFNILGRVHLAMLSLRLLLSAHRSTLFSLAHLELTLAAGMTIYVSSAYLNVKFPSVTVKRSAALMILSCRCSERTCYGREIKSTDWLIDFCVRTANLIGCWTGSQCSNGLAQERLDAWSTVRELHCSWLAAVSGSCCSVCHEAQRCNSRCWTGLGCILTSRWMTP